MIWAKTTVGGLSPMASRCSSKNCSISDSSTTTEANPADRLPMYCWYSRCCRICPRRKSR